MPLLLLHAQCVWESLVPSLFIGGTAQFHVIPITASIVDLGGFLGTLGQATTTASLSGGLGGQFFVTSATLEFDLNDVPFLEANSIFGTVHPAHTLHFDSAITLGHAHRIISSGHMWFA